MNYFDLHIGDYDQATAHLSACEDGIYGRLLRRYYATEKPLELDMGLLQRKVRARTKEEKQAVLDVLSEFFSQQPDGWHQKTCDEVLEKFLAGAPERDAKKANAETRLQRHREERAALFSIINAAGEHYPYNTQIAELRAHAVRLKSATPATPLHPSPATFHATAPATPATATQYPLPSTHNPIPNLKEKPRKRGPAAEQLVSVAQMMSEGVEEQHAKDWLIARRKKDLPLTPTAWGLVKSEASKAGLTPAEAVKRAASEGWAGFKASWLAEGATQSGRSASGTATDWTAGAR